MRRARRDYRALAFSRTPHGEERGEAARLEPWAAGTPLARGPSFRLRPSGYGGQVETALRASSATRLTRGMAGFVVNNNESTRPLSCKRPTLAGAGRNSNRGFSPIPLWRGRQKN